MENSRINFIVGLVVLVSLLILLIGVNFLKNTVPGEKRDRYSAAFAAVSTLQVGDPVRMNGVTMGRVSNIVLWNHQVLVSFYLKHGFKDDAGTFTEVRIPKNSVIRVQNIGLMGERQLELELGDTAAFYAPGDTLFHGEFDAGIAEAFGTLGRVAEQAEVLVGVMAGVVDSTVGQKDFVPMFRQVVAETRGLAGRMNSLVGDVDPKVRASVSNLQRASGELEALLDRKQGPVFGLVQDGRTVVGRVDSLVRKSAAIAGEVDQILRQLQSDRGTLGALINDETFQRELRSTLANTDSLLLIIQKRGLDVNIDIF